MQARGHLAHLSGIAAVVLAVVALPAPSPAFDPQPDPPAARCQARKLKAAGKLALCRAKVLGAFDPQPDPPKLATCQQKFTTVFANAEDKGGCLTVGDAESVEATVNAATKGLQSALQAGPRFIDNDDGTISDLETGLMWEKKSMDGGLHDVESELQWSATLLAPHAADGSAFVTFLATLNGGTGPNTCFAGHCDWRLPTLQELEGLYVADLDPAIDPIFSEPCEPDCEVTTCSCTTSMRRYLSTSTVASDPSSASNFDFGGGFADVDPKYGNDLAVRAVRDDF